MAVVVTYRRHAVLLDTLQAVVDQSRPPDKVIVVDNDASPLLEQRLTERFEEVDYLAIEENVGYGAGLAAGMRHLRDRYDPDWYWLLDDDSPPSADDLGAALRVAEGPFRPSVVANRGGHIRAGLIRHDLQEVESVSQADFTLVDGTLISRSAVDAVGFPREDLFMMLEDVEYSTRIARAGGVLVVRPGRANALHLGSSSSWRSYYQARNHLRIALDRRSLPWIWGWLYRTCAQSIVDVRRGRWDALRHRRRGAFDALRGRMGRTVEPGSGA